MKKAFFVFFSLLTLYTAVTAFTYFSGGSATYGFVNLGLALFFAFIAYGGYLNIKKK